MHAPVVNHRLAALLANERDPLEEISVDQATVKGLWALGSLQAEILKCGRVVRLACGHFTQTKALRKARCQRCGEMIRSGYDYDAFRRSDEVDSFIWPDDPFRAAHETEPARAGVG